MFAQIGLIAIVLYLLYRFFTPRRPPNFPPGPKEYPLAGGGYIIPKLDKKSFSGAMMKLGDIYGPVTGIYLGMNRAIVINGYETVKEVLTRDEFQGRPNFFIHEYANGGTKLGVMFSDGERWKEQRRFTLRHLRDFGFGKAKMENVVHEEVQGCLQTIKNLLNKTKDSVIPLHDVFGPPIINVLWVIISGKRYAHDDPKFLHLLQLLARLFRNGNLSGGLLNDWPILRFFPYFSNQWNPAMESRNAVSEMLEKEIKEHRATRDTSFSRDFIDLYLKEIDEKGGEASSFYSKEQLQTICADLFNAGAESTSNTVAFGMLYMILYPEIQTKIQEELDQVVGRDRLPSYNDRVNLPYTEAVMCELMRMTGIAPNTVPHSTVQDTKLHGYDIPKDTLVLIMLKSVHDDKAFWGDPDVFRPSRFLDQEGKFIKSERLISFGLGKRVCLGEVLARMNYFDFFTAILQSFRLEVAPGQPKPTTDANQGFTLAPHPFSAKLTPR